MAFVKKYLLKGIFISILTIFAMSHNAFAIESLSNNVDIVAVRTGEIKVVTWTCGSDPSCPSGFVPDSWVSNINGFGGSAVQSFRIKIPARQYHKGEIVTIDLYFFLNNIQANHSALTSLITSTSGFHVSTVEFQQLTDNSAKGTIFLHVLQDVDKTSSNAIDLQGSVGSALVFNSSSNSADPANIRLGVVTVWSVVQGTNYSQALNEIKEEIKNSNDDVEEKTQEAVEESEAAGSDSSSTASQGSANLLSAITGFFNVITTAQPSNCRFNAPLNTYFGNERLNVDLCALDLPSGIGALTSIIAIGILIPFAIHMFNKFIALFRSFQN